MLTYASPARHAFINRRLYLPESWITGLARRAAAHIPEQVAFATKPALVITMLEEELAAGTPFGYLAADSGYGRDPALRAFCPHNTISYVMAVPVDLPSIDVHGQTEPAGHVLDRLLARGDPSSWERRACGHGTKGERHYDWSSVTVSGQALAPERTHTLLIRRSIARPDDI